MPPTTNNLLKPWSVILDERLGLYRDLHSELIVMLEKGKGVQDLDVVRISMILDRLGPVR